MRLEVLEKRLQSIEERMVELEGRRFNLPQAEALRLDATLAQYRQERAAVCAQLDDVKTQIIRLRKQLGNQRALREAYLQRAEQSERRAAQLEQQAAQLAE